MGYSELKDQLRDAPQTWLPALFLEVVSACVKKGVFASDEAMLRVCQNQMRRTRSPRVAARENKLMKTNKSAKDQI